MNVPSTRPGDCKDFFQLGERCLGEEVGLEPGADYAPLIVSWMGYNVSAALVHVVGHARCGLGRSEIERRLASSHGAYESDRIGWIPDTKSALEEIVNHRGDGRGIRWIDSAPLAAHQYWKARTALQE